MQKYSRKNDVIKRKVCIIIIVVTNLEFPYFRLAVSKYIIIIRYLVFTCVIVFFSGLLTHNTFFDDSAYRQRRHANGKFYVSSFILSYSFTTCKLQETSNYFYFNLSTYLLKDKQGHLKNTYISTIRILSLADREHYLPQFVLYNECWDIWLSPNDQLAN